MAEKRTIVVKFVTVDDAESIGHMESSGNIPRYIRDAVAAQAAADHAVRDEAIGYGRDVCLARGRVLDLMGEVSRMKAHAESYPEDDFDELGDCDVPSAEWLEGVVVKLSRINRMLHDAEGVVIREQMRRRVK